MQTRSKRLQQKAEGRSRDEEKTNRRMSAGDVLGLNVPADSKDLEHVQALSVVEAVAVKLDSCESKKERNAV